MQGVPARENRPEGPLVPRVGLVSLGQRIQGLGIRSMAWVWGVLGGHGIVLGTCPWTLCPVGSMLDEGSLKVRVSSCSELGAVLLKNHPKSLFKIHIPRFYSQIF